MKIYKASSFITIIMVATIITILTGGFYTIISNNITVTYNNIERSRLFFAAEGGLNYGIKWLKSLPVTEINKINAITLNNSNLTFEKGIDVDLLVDYTHNAGVNEWNISSISSKVGSKECELSLKKITLTESGGSSTAFNNALEFDGKNSYGTINDKKMTRKIASKKTFTVMSWVKWSVDPATGNGWANIVTNNSNTRSDRGQFWLQHSSGNRLFEFALSTDKGRRFVQSKTKPKKDVWYHIAGVYTGTQLQIYVNGVLENAVSHSKKILKHDDSYITTIGGWAYRGNNYRRFTGSIDEVSLWEKALTENEVKDNMISALNGKEKKLIAYWNFDENSGLVLDDLSKNKFDADLSGITQNNWITSGAGGDAGSGSGNGNTFTGEKVWDVQWK